MKYCAICHTACNESILCERHKETYVYDPSILGFRLKKRYSGYNSRYTGEKFHKNEIRLTKILEGYYGKTNVITSYHPLWAVSVCGVLYEYDILIKDKHLLVEYNGRQHYEYTQFFHKNKLAFEEQKIRDKIKADLAKINSYSLVVFKHDEQLTDDYVLYKIRSCLDE